MASDPSITQYIRQQMGAGFSRQQVYDALLEAGWYKEDIEQAFYEVANQSYGAAPVPAAVGGVQKAGKGSHSHKKVLAALIILIAIVAVVFAASILLPGSFLGMLNPLL